MVELLKQGQYTPMHVADQVISIFAGTQGFCDDVPLSRIADFEAALLKHVQDQFGEVREQLVQSGELTDEIRDKLLKIIGDFKRQFVAAKQDGGATGRQ
jgi:F-type H+-transporting ATPase subunit alpha